MRSAVVLLGLVACSGPDSVEGRVDARGPDYTYVVSDLDLTGPVMDAVNALAAGIDIDGTLDARIARGTTIMLVNVKANDLATANGVGFFLYVGSNPVPPACVDAADQVCRRHLSGAATFEAAAAEDNVAAGRIINHKYLGSAADLTVRLGDVGGVTVAIPLQAAQIELQTLELAAWERGTIAGAIAASDLDTAFIPGLAALVRVSAPAVTDAEVATAVHGVPLDRDLDEDGTDDALAIGLEIQGVPSWFTPAR